MASFTLLFITVALCASVSGERPRPPVESSDIPLLREAALHRSNRVGEEWFLPKNLVPEWYNIRLLPFLDEGGNFTTDGHVEIFVHCLQNTTSVVLNVAEITIVRNSVTVVQSDNNLPLNVEDVIVDDVHQMVIISIGTQLMAGSKYRVAMNFISYLTDNLVGFYRSSYIENDVRKWLAITDFESTDARRAFPCFDEPEYKAIFYVTLGRKLTWKAASNMPLKETIPMEGQMGYVWDVFESSVRMQTYTVAFMVCEFDYVTSSPDLSNIPVSIWGRPDVRDWMEYASIIGPKVLEFYENYFEVDYALPKLYMAAIPNLSPGAMENFGLITYQERYLLFDPKKTTAYSKQIIAEIIAHEIAHMWTGNLVTMKWWNELWLNEGFAEYLQYLATDDVEPTFGEMEQFLVLTMQPVLVSDSVPTSRPINMPVFTPPETRLVFDTITYSKGASVIRMMADFIGQETFRRGMKLYLKRMSFSNAGQEDLYRHLEEQMVLDNVKLPATLETIMDTWIFQMNYPLVTVNRDYLTGTATVAQDRFLRIPDPDDTLPSKYNWWIPLTYKRGSGAPSVEWMPPNVLNISLNLGAPSDEWVIFNLDEKGYYRVKYDPKNYELIRDQLLASHTVISTNNRAQLLDDAFNLAVLGMVSYASALDLTLYLGKERDYTPWEAVLPELDYIHSMFVNRGGNANWESHMRDLVTPYFYDVGFKEGSSDPHLKILSRNHVINWACKLGIAECKQNATDTFRAWSQSPIDEEVISRNQKTAILCAGVEHGTESEWEYAYQRFLNPLDVNENGAILSAMGCTTIGSLHTRMLNMMVDDSSGIVGGNAVSLFNALARNPSANKAALDFLNTQWNTLAQRYPNSMVGFFQVVSSKYNTVQQLTEMEALRDSHMDVLGDNGTVNSSIQTVQANINWMNNYSDDINSWLSSKNKT